MATPNSTLIDALRKAAAALQQGAHYAWGHHGACNCGHLLQAMTQLDEATILSYAHTGPGEWTEIATESCAVTGAPYTLLLSVLEQYGLTPTDIHHIEYLNDTAVLKQLPGGFRWLKRNVREDVIAYFETFASLLENEWLKQAELLLAAVPQQQAVGEQVLQPA
ncbi:MAG TPA: hypothetical protein VL307_00680 [Chitinophagaceae bacterium]|nr:hypothetical protein [Chitinophagaceae bacterium]